MRSGRRVMPIRWSLRGSSLRLGRMMSRLTHVPRPDAISLEDAKEASRAAPLEVRVRIAHGLDAVPAALWDASANPAPGSDQSASNGAAEPLDSYNPFVSHAFLSALEDSGCVGGRSGWVPAHVLVDGPGEKLMAGAPRYVETPFPGGNVFDPRWGGAFERAGGGY